MAKVIFSVFFIGLILITHGCGTEGKIALEESECVSESGEDENGVRNTIDDMIYEYSDNTNISVHLFADEQENKEVMLIISCDKKDYNFGILCYMQSAIKLSSTEKNIDFLVLMNCEDNNYATIREDGEIMKSNEIESDDLFPSDNEINFSLEFESELEGFLIKNKIQ